ncbi:MAG TPA: HigA family addiction module antitoxin [Candidatus Paceibacterota bacterium]|nr:HigA family addiction module antitoxin [Candidatus Paceibacterota bacterium]
MRKPNQLEPNYAVPPGATLLETIESLGMSQAELASRMGRPLKTINEIVKGKAAITPETALELEKVLGAPASFWNNAERNYRETLARLENERQLEREVAWARQFPYAEMAKRGWVPGANAGVQRVQALLRFLGIASTEQWATFSLQTQGAYRESRSFQSDSYALGCWLRQGELAAQKIACAPFSETAFRSALQEARTLTAAPPEQAEQRLRELCAASGVAFVVVPEIKGTHVSGVTRWLHPAKALIQQSLRHKTDDHFWFTFFHEAGHILLHGKKAVFLEFNGITDPKEAEADQFARNCLIASAEWDAFLKAGRPTQASVRALARKLRIAPGIVVGRLQHDRIIPHSHFNELRTTLRLTPSAARVSP